MVPYDTEFIRGLNSRTYWRPTKEVCDAALASLSDEYGEKEGAVKVLDELKTVLWDSSEGVGKIVDKRIERGEISDKGQASVSIAGNNFQALVGYCLEINRIVGNIPQELNIALKPKKHPVIEKYATISVADGEAQKPDVDLLLYLEDEGSPIMVCSCKTSLRERAGQTYRWKLLMDMSMCNCEHDTDCPMHQYNLEYQSDRKVLVNLITADFYDESGSAQQRGMFTFFDNVYVTQEIEEFANVRRFSGIIKTLNTVFEPAPEQKQNRS